MLPLRSLTGHWLTRLGKLGAVDNINYVYKMRYAPILNDTEHCDQVEWLYYTKVTYRMNVSASKSNIPSHLTLYSTYIAISSHSLNSLRSLLSILTACSPSGPFYIGVSSLTPSSMSVVKGRYSGPGTWRHRRIGPSLVVQWPMAVCGRFDVTHTWHYVHFFY